MKPRFIIQILLIISSVSAVGVKASEFDLWKAASAGIKAYQAVTLSDEKVIEYVRESVAYMDSENDLLPESNPYSVRLKRITAGLNRVNGIPLNFKVYKTKEYNAFACADGSVRVYSALMDLMTDDELLGVIGHEIGHVGLHHSRKEIKQSLLTGALRDVLSSSEGVIGSLADSQLGALSEVMIGAKYSRKQETEADDYGYEFLKKHQKNPWVIVMAFEKLKSASSRSSAIEGYITQMFSTHPNMQNRINRISEKCKKEGYKRPVSK